MTNFRVVVFDVYRTLIDIQSDEHRMEAYEFISSWLSYKGLRIEPSTLLGLYKEKTEHAILTNTELYPDIDLRDVFKEIISLIDNTMDTDKREALAEEIGLFFRILTTKSLTIYPETIPTLRSLQKKTRLAVLSNTQRIFTIPEFRKFDIEKYFECIIFSSDVRASKPSAKIFTALLNAMKIQPQDAVYVGDNLYDDIWGAQKVGMKTVWINRGGLQTFPSELRRPIPDRQLDENSYRNLLNVILSII
jgi:putative hydrolase of the HAD superfamily